VFLSYSHRDRDKAEQIAADLIGAGLTVWWDVNRIGLGDRLRETINRGIRSSRAFVILLSTSSLVSEWVLNELDAAMIREITEKRRFVIPVLLGKLNYSKMPSDLQGKQYLDLRYNFPARYKTRRASLVQCLKIAAAPVPENAENGISIYTDFTHFLLDYKFSGRNEDETKKVPEEVMEALGESLFESIGKVRDFKGEFKEFNQLFGPLFGRKLTLFMCDQSGMSWTKGFTEDDLGALTAELHLMMSLMILADSLAKADWDLRLILDGGPKSVYLAGPTNRR
jgi:hypothetical protein